MTKRRALFATALAASAAAVLLASSCGRHEAGVVPAEEPATAAPQEKAEKARPEEDAPETQATPVESAGGRRATVRSGFPCKGESDCTSTKFSNAPTKREECTCQAACTPFVVSVAEKARREAANEKLCGKGDWLGDGCPAPPCGFIRFDAFECIEGRCVGHALVE